MVLYIEPVDSFSNELKSWCINEKRLSNAGNEPFWLVGFLLKWGCGWLEIGKIGMMSRSVLIFGWDAQVPSVGTGVRAWGINLY